MANTAQSGVPVSFAYQCNDADQRIRTLLVAGSCWVNEYDEQFNELVDRLTAEANGADPEVEVAWGREIRRRVAAVNQPRQG